MDVLLFRAEHMRLAKLFLSGGNWFLSHQPLPDVAVHLGVGPCEIPPHPLACHLLLSSCRPSLGNHVAENSPSLSCVGDAS